MGRNLVVGDGARKRQRHTGLEAVGSIGVFIVFFMGENFFSPFPFATKNPLKSLLGILFVHP